MHGSSFDFLPVCVAIVVPFQFIASPPCAGFMPSQKNIIILLVASFGFKEHRSPVCRMQNAECRIRGYAVGDGDGEEAADAAGAGE